jgi:cytidylate kinase
MPEPPVIAIDGPSGSGKGTVARLIAQELGFHYLDSGALYRLVALAAERHGIPLQDEAALAQMTAALDIEFSGEKVFLSGEDVSLAIRDEAVSRAASIVSAYPAVREALLARQRAFRKPPGLVAEGRDMTTVVFPDAALKIFLTASREERAMRRYKQLLEKGMRANLGHLLRDIAERDERDANRAAAPLKQAKDAIVLDTTNLDISETVAEIMGRYAR